MVFPRNAGFGRCYLVSTRHEILSNIDRNLTGTRLRLRKNRNKINPARVRIPSQFYSVIWVSNSSFPAFRLSPKKVWEVHNKKKVLLPQSHANLALAPNLKFSNWEYSVKDNGGRRIKRYTVVISILSRIRSIYSGYISPGAYFKKRMKLPLPPV